MERDKSEKKKTKNISESDYSDNKIHVNINVGTSDNHRDDNSDNSVKSVSEIKEVQDKKIDDKKEIDNMDAELSKLKFLIKEFNQKKEELINKKIDIPNDIFDLPDIEINSKSDIIRLSDILKDKINKLNQILINAKEPIQIQPSKPTSQPLPLNPFMNNFQTNMRSPFPFQQSQFIRPFPTGSAEKPNTRTPPAPTPTPEPAPTPAPTEAPTPEPAPEPETRPDRDVGDTGLTDTQLEIENELLDVGIDEYNQYKLYYDSNKNSSDIRILNEIIQLANVVEPKLKKIQNDLFLTRNKNKIQNLIERLQGNRSDINIKAQNLRDIKPPDDDDADDEEDIAPPSETPPEPPPYEPPNEREDFKERMKILFEYKSKLNNTGRSPNAYSKIERQIDRNINFIDNALIRGDDISPEEINYILSLRTLMDNSQGLFEPAVAYANIEDVALEPSDTLSLIIDSDASVPEGARKKYLLIKNGNQEVLGSENLERVYFNLNGDIYSNVDLLTPNEAGEFEEGIPEIPAPPPTQPAPPTQPPTQPPTEFPTQPPFQEPPEEPPQDQRRNRLIAGIKNLYLNGRNGDSTIVFLYNEILQTLQNPRIPNVLEIVNFDVAKARAIEQLNAEITRDSNIVFQQEPTDFPGADVRYSIFVDGRKILNQLGEPEYVNRFGDTYTAVDLQGFNPPILQYPYRDVDL